MKNRTMKAAPRATAAQARLIARLWGNIFHPTIGVAVDARGYTDPTTLACVKRGWLVAIVEFHTSPNGARHQLHAVSPAGLLALEHFLFAERCKAKK